MTDDNKQNLLYFENESMRGLYEDMEAWQKANQKRLLSVSIETDRGKFCCIALSNPMEVMIVGGMFGGNTAMVDYGFLLVKSAQ